MATAHLDAKAEATLGAAHTAHAARERDGKVLTGDRTFWASAHPDVDAVTWSD